MKKITMHDIRIAIRDMTAADFTPELRINLDKIELMIEAYKQDAVVEQLKAMLKVLENKS